MIFMAEFVGASGRHTGLASVFITIITPDWNSPRC